MRTCTICKEEKPLVEFNKNNRTKDALSPYCRPCQAQKKREWSAANKEHVKEYRAFHYAEFKEDEAESGASYRKANPHKRNHWQAKRRSRMSIGLTPTEKEQIENMYWLVRDLKAISGQDYHVDHIHPLSKGGLHHPDNLQVLPADINIKKGASPWQTAP